MTLDNFKEELNKLDETTIHELYNFIDEDIITKTRVVVNAMKPDKDIILSVYKMLKGEKAFLEQKIEYVDTYGDYHYRLKNINEIIKEIDLKISDIIIKNTDSINVYKKLYEDIKKSIIDNYNEICELDNKYKEEHDSLSLHATGVLKPVLKSIIDKMEENESKLGVDS